MQDNSAQHRQDTAAFNDFDAGYACFVDNDCLIKTTPAVMPYILLDCCSNTDCFPHQAGTRSFVAFISVCMNFSYYYNNIYLINTSIGC